MNSHKGVKGSALLIQGQIEKISLFSPGKFGLFGFSPIFAPVPFINP